MVRKWTMSPTDKQGVADDDNDDDEDVGNDDDDDDDSDDANADNGDDVNAEDGDGDGDVVESGDNICNDVCVDDKGNGDGDFGVVCFC